MNLPGQPSSAVKALFRLPVLLYRVGLGGFERIFGIRFLLLTTTGRRSGLPRSAMLDLVGNDGDTYFVESGWNERSAWVKNIRANPEVSVQVGRQKFRAKAFQLSPQEGAQRMFDFFKAHPLYAKAVLSSHGGGLDLKDEQGLRKKLEADSLVFGLKRQ